MKRYIPWGVALLLLAGCSAPPSMRYIYPVPPEQPRIEWLGTYATQDDFPKGQLQIAFEGIAGTPPLDGFVGPYGIASDGAGQVFIVDLYMRNIRVFDFNKRETRMFLDKPLLVRPYYLAIDSKKQLYVADAGRQEVLVFSPDARLVRIYGSSAELTNPLCVEIDEKRGRLYISDARPGQINVYDLADGKRLLAFGLGQLMGAQGMAIAPDGSLYVADTLNAAIKVFDPQGNFLRKIGERNDSEWGMEHPKDLAFDSEGNLWLLDYRKNVVRIYTPEGRPLLTFGGASTYLMGFSTPVAIYISPEDEVFITDFMGKRFSHWRYLSKSALARHPLTAADLEAVK